MNDELLEAVQDLQEQAAELDYLDDLGDEPGIDGDACFADFRPVSVIL